MVEEKQLIQQGVFEFPATKNVLNWYGTSDKPWFCLREVCNILGVKKTSDKSNLLSNSQKVTGSIDTPGGLQETTFISESGLYKIIMSCRTRKDIVVKFQDWVCEEVLPSIRKTGSYHIDEKEQESIRASRVQSTTLALRTAVDILHITGGLDERDKIMVRDMARNLVSETNSASNLSREFSLSRRIQEKFRMRYQREDWIPLGRRCASAYRTFYGKNPIKRDQFVDGTTRGVFSYTEQNYVDCLDKVIKDYYEEKKKKNKGNARTNIR